MRKAPLPAEGLQVLPGSLRPLQALSELGALAAGVAGGLVRLPSARAEMPAAPLAWVAAGPNYGSSPARPGASREPSHRHLPMLMVSTTTPFPGEAVGIHVEVPKARTLLGAAMVMVNTARRRLVRVTAAVEGDALQLWAFQAKPGCWRAFVPVTAAESGGCLPLTVEVADGRHRPILLQLRVQEGRFPHEHVNLPPHKANLRPSKKEAQAVAQLVATASPARLSQGAFAWPAWGELTSGYGVSRTYNGRLAKGYFHQGVDIGARQGSPVVAPAAGRVGLVGRESDGFAVNGNCVGIDHGQGLTSMLLHMERVFVKPGQRVAKGSVLGTVGSSGLSTGPHLHWGLYLHGRCIDPSYWTASKPVGRGAPLAWALGGIHAPEARDL